MKNFIIVLLLGIVGIILSIYVTQFNGPYFDITYLIAPPFLYFLTLVIYPKVKQQRLSYHMLGILGAIAFYIVVASWGDLEQIIPAMTTSLLSTFILFIIAIIKYGKQSI